MAKVISFFWSRYYQNCCRMFRSPFVTAYGFSMMRFQRTSALMCAWYEFHVKARWIGHGGPVPWTPWSPYFSSFDYFLWGYLKNLVYETSLDSDDDLAARLSEAVHVCVKYQVSLAMYNHRFIDAVKHLSLILGAILNRLCKNHTCQRCF